MTGSAHDASASMHTVAGHWPEWMFKGNEFAWTDSAYTLTAQTIPVHKKPASFQQNNSIFDSAVAHLRI